MPFIHPLKDASQSEHGFHGDEIFRVFPIIHARQHGAQYGSGELRYLQHNHRQNLLNIEHTTLLYSPHAYMIGTCVHYTFSLTTCTGHAPCSHHITHSVTHLVFPYVSHVPQSPDAVHPYNVVGVHLSAQEVIHDGPGQGRRVLASKCAHQLRNINNYCIY